MAVPSSGELKLRADIALEVNGSATGTNVSLHQMSIDSGFTTPDPMGEFYGYSACAEATVGQNTISSTSSTAFRHNMKWDNPSQCATRYRYYYGTNSTVRSNPAYTKATNDTSVEYDATNYFTGLSPSTTYYVEAFAESSIFGTTYAPSKTVGTSAPPLGISWEATSETVGGYASGDYQNQFGVIDFNGNWYTCINATGWSLNQNISGAGTATMTQTVTGISSYFSTNWNPYQSVSVTNNWNGSPGSHYISWNDSLELPNYNGSNIFKSCGRGLTTNLRFSRSGYTNFGPTGVGKNQYGPSDIRLKTNINYL